MDDINNFSNMMFHEWNHYDRQVFVNSKGRYRTINSSEEEHIEIFQNQENHWTWDKTTPEFKKRRDYHIRNSERQIEKKKNGN